MDTRVPVRIGALLVAWGVTVGIAHRLAPRLDRGEPGSPEIRRAVVAGELRLPDLPSATRRVHLDLAMAGAVLGWRPESDAPMSLDLTVHAKMAGLQVSVPAETRVWWRSRGPGGVDVARGSDLQRVESPQDAQLRLDATLIFAGVSLLSD